MWRRSALIIPSLLARRQSIDDSLQKLPDSVLKLVSRAPPLAESMCSPKRSGNRSWPWIVESLIFYKLNRKVIGNFSQVWKRAADSGSRAVYGVGLQPLAWRDCRFESARGMTVSFKCCILSGRSICDGPIPRPEESYRMCCVWAWFRNFNDEDA